MPAESKTIALFHFKRQFAAIAAKGHAVARIVELPAKPCTLLAVHPGLYLNVFGSLEIRPVPCKPPLDKLATLDASYKHYHNYHRRRHENLEKMLLAGAAPLKHTY